MSARIITLDIERVPMWTKRLPAWDMRSLMSRRLTPDDVDEWGRTICLAYRVRGERQIHFLAEWQEGGRPAFLRAAWDVYDGADVIVGHNIQDFDTPHLQGEWMLEFGYLPSPVKHIDTLKLARKHANYEANHLDTLDKRFGHGGKTDKYRIGTAMDAVNGDVKAQRKLERYNQGDIRATERVLKRLLPLSNVNLGLYETDDIPRCPACGSTELESRGYAYTAISAFPRYRCKKCGKWSKGKKSEYVVEVRPA